MFYIYITALILLSFVVGYLLFYNDDNEENNLLEDVPNIYVNREGLEKHALQISTYYSETRNLNCKRKLIKSLEGSYKGILKGYDYIDKDVKAKKEVVPAAEWLLDNIYLIEKEYKDIRHNMPEGYYKNLPVIDKGIMKGYPRIYHIAVELVSHTDGLLDEGTIESFVKAYQKNVILTSGELWALPIMLRVALIQNISKIVEKIRYAQSEKNYGEAIADRLINAANDKRLPEELNKLNSERINFSSHLVERLIKVLRDNGIDNSEVYQWIDEKLEVNQSNSERMINMEHQKEAYFQISIGNSITSIRVVEALNWKEFYERISYVENILKVDPAGVYEKMDFESRDYYRHRLEKISRNMKLPESFVAKKVVECAEQAMAGSNESYKRHIGYYIIDDGIDLLQAKLNMRNGSGYRFNNWLRKKGGGAYISAIIIGVALLEVLTMFFVASVNRDMYWWTYVIAFIGVLIPCSEVVISVFNWTINNITTPRIIPKLSLEDGIPEESSTVVVIPTLINSEKRVKELIHDMEVYYLANSEKNLYFALLSDFKDSESEHENGDEELIEAALKEVKILNEKYGLQGKDKFYFLSRYRMFNEKQNKWMGWERKRGKLMEFNSLLRGDRNTSYNVVSGDISPLAPCKYVITLDADTQLPRDAAKRLIGAMSHVLNIPHFDTSSKRVVRGYGVMQPRVSVGILNANKTIFSKIFSGETGIDIYTTAVSDVYQDAFAEGIFTGKGIYDIDIFEKVLKAAIPENTVLSHDLLEGSYARTALVTDIELVDGYPAYYISSSKRLHRWVRGDWQLLPWFKKSSPLNAVSKWKIVDNLRRSLLTPSIIILLLLALTVLPVNGPFIILAFLAILCPILFDVSEAVAGPIKGISLSGRLNSIKVVIEQFFLIFSFLPYQTYLMLDAILRTLYRVFISKRNLLEWETAADVERKSGKRLNDYMRHMWIGSAAALIIGILAFNISFSLGAAMLPALIIWFVSPVTAWFISKEITYKKIELNKDEYKLLRRLSRKTWAYFEDFVNSENNWLAPDNFQEDPHNGVAHRTSPTNIGMGFVSCIAAHDLGYIGVTEAIDRVDKILSSIESLTKHKGHLYNWYDTLTKAPLFPRYVSTVDSGNMVSYMWVTSEALAEYICSPLINRKFIQGMKDLVELAYEEGKMTSIDLSYYRNAMEKLEDFNVFTWKEFLMELRSKAIDTEKTSEGNELYWSSKIKSSTGRLLGELQHYAPWIDLVKDKADGALKEQLARICDSVPLEDMSMEIDGIIKYIDSLNASPEGKYLEELRVLLENSSAEIDSEISRVYELQGRLNKFVENTDFKMLFDKKRGLFTIGYDVEKESINNSYYDLLASEARAASFIAIAKGDVEQKHWFKLGRSMTLMGNSKGLVSWSGTMFEYFMPLLIMKDYPESLLHETYKAVIEGQKHYCRERKIPWGISESAFHTFDVNLNYQYKAFGVPGIGLKRGLANELVIAPYATVMTLQSDLKGAVENIRRLINEGTEGRYGLYEAVDYTKERLPKGKKKSIVKCFMVHHEGMSLMALNNVLNDNIFQNRFHRIPRVKATELLLQERVPRRVIYDREQQFNAMEVDNEKYSVIVRAYNTAKTEMPETHLLSNGSYSLMVTNSGSGYSKKDDMTIYRWREDVTLDSSGMFFYIKNINSNEYWSAAYEPCKNEGEDYQVIFSLDKAEFKRKDGNLITHTEIGVSSEDDAEVRRITITNHSEHTRVVEITSYCEVTLAPYNADVVHPTFSNLFIKTEYIDNPSCVLANRRPRAKGQVKPWVMQTVAVDGESVGTIQYETSRLNFIGRGRDITSPEVVENDAPLLNTVGAVLDPIISIRRRVKIKAGESCRIAYTTGVAYSREEVIELANKYREMQNVSRVFEMAWTQSQVEMKYLGIKSNQANLYQLMASKIIFLNNLLTDREDYIKNISKHQKDLWPFGISGDVPIVLLKVKDEKDLDLVRQMLYAHEYWTVKGLKVDLVVINEEGAGYTQPVQDAVRDLIHSSHARDKQNKQGGVYLHSKSTMNEEIINFLMAISRLVIDSEKGTLMNQIRNGDSEKEEVSFIKIEAVESEAMDKEAVSYIRNKTVESIGQGTVNSLDKESDNAKDRNTGRKFNFKWNRRAAYSTEFSTELGIQRRRRSKLKYDINKLHFYNGFGGFNNENGSYVIVLSDFENTPAPWINVMSNEKFGFHVSESGSSYTWSRNSRENKITPWSNDPISDIPGEVLYLRDEVTGDIWSITPKPLRDSGEYVIEHGFGYSSFSHEAFEIEGTGTMFTPIDEDCKICIVKLKNKSNHKRTISLTYYAQMVLGVVPQQNAQYISTYIDRQRSYIYAMNPYSEHFGKLKAFLRINGGMNESFTGSRKEFLGRGESISDPAALRMEKFSGLCGAGFDPCLAQNSKLELLPGEEKSLSIVFGQYEELDEINKIIEKYRDIKKAEESLKNTKNYWRELLGRIQVRTPDRSMDLMLNGWLMYQTLSCRYWSRTAFYQSGGAYGYRDQLQDTLSIGILDSTFTKEQILRSAERQFLEGDVQHWWHPVVDSGIRTRFSDDLLWLPYVTADYIRRTGDYSILDEEVSYLEDEPLKEGEDERYNIARKSEVKGTIYEHCIKAIERGLQFGSHNIPLMGSGDWNDGMSTVGNKGKGESVWLGWFLYDILDDFKDLCAYRGDSEKVEKYTELLEFIRINMEENAWDGSWYRRAYFDDGTPLGSIQNDECQIDSLAQSWGVISGAAKESRAQLAMESLEKYLVREDSGMILLLTPPFNKSMLEPGYIKGYVPGVRENGGQYTHAAVWVIMAMAKLGRGDEAWRLYNMINPINHSTTILECERYKVEPYVMAADVYIKEPHTGRGGWSWYTGAAGWMFRVGVESILGLNFMGKEGFTVEPNIPINWEGFEMKYTKENCVYHIKVKRGKDKQILLNGEVLENPIIPYMEKGDHLVEVII
jgi:cyclic beta-1,2-glucan synthetase